MPSYSVCQVSLAIVFALAISTTASPQVAFPINSQVPPVAYVSQPFEFTFSPNTFTSENNEISYTLARQPSWLSLDGSTRRLSGTPTSADRGAPNFELIASDTSGQTTSSVTLVVLEEQTLLPDNAKFLSQLTSVGSVSAPATLLLRPQQVFGFSLSQSLFNGTSDSTVYYAVSSNGSPLPSWLQFDSAAIRFSGTTPPILQPPPSQQTFSFKLTASNVIGFSEASVPFEILVGNSLLAFREPSLSVTAVKGSALEIPSLLGNITIDGLTAMRDQIASAQADSPSWLNLDNTDLSFRGLVPENATTSTFLFTVNSLSTNAANMTITLQVNSEPNMSQISLGNTSAVGGSYFNYVIVPPSGFDISTSVTVNSTDLPVWLSFVATNRTLQGLVPSDVVPEERLIRFTFSNNTRSETADLTLVIQRAASTATQTIPSATATVSGTGSGSPQNSAASTSSHSWQVILAVVLPVFALIFVIWAIVAWMKRRKRAKEQSEGANFRHQPDTNMHESESRNGDALSMPGSVLPYENAGPAINSTPQVELSWAPDSLGRTRNRLSKKRKISHSSMIGSSWDDLIDFRAQSRDDIPQERYGLFKGRKDSDTLAFSNTTPLRAAPKRPSRPDIDHFHSFRVSKGPRQGSAEAARPSKRLSGAGHGAGRSQPINPPDPRSSWQTTMGTIPRGDSRSSTAVMGSFPAPPSHGSIAGAADTNASRSQQDQDPKSTLRLVDSSNRESELADNGRQNYHTRKARRQLEGSSRHPNAFSGAQSMSTFAEEATEPLPEAVPDLPSRLNLGDLRSYGPPPVPRKSQARLRASSGFSSADRPQYSSNQTINRETSVASSHQFDSAVSSDSQWEDENLVSEENAVGEIYWHNETNLSNDKPSPRLPFTPSRASEQDTSGKRTIPAFHKPRLADQRQAVTVESAELERSQRSQKGSFRFV